MAATVARRRWSSQPGYVEVSGYVEGGVLFSVITQIVFMIPQIEPSAKSASKSAKLAKLRHDYFGEGYQEASAEASMSMERMWR